MSTLIPFAFILFAFVLGAWVAYRLIDEEVGRRRIRTRLFEKMEDD